SSPLRLLTVPRSVLKDARCAHTVNRVRGADFEVNLMLTAWIHSSPIQDTSPGHIRCASGHEF
ncbi:MAG TPA: hypothetical protein VMO81_10765, partial [Aestuariivirgaceae bacterium]|nr:hypothetical protein [Aestuariivirgaceae bacterium]